MTRQPPHLDVLARRWPRAWALVEDPIRTQAILNLADDSPKQGVLRGHLRLPGPRAFCYLCGARPDGQTTWRWQANGRWRCQECRHWCHSKLGVWDVDRLHDEADGLPVQHLRVSELHWHLHLSEVDPGHAMTGALDMDEPILLMEHAMPHELFNGRVIVDGRHRVYRALATGIFSLPAQVVPKAIAETCRLAGPDGAAPAGMGATS